MFRRVFLWLLIPAAALILLAESPMAFGKTLVLASQINGILIDKDGTPQSGVQIERSWRWEWNDTTGRDETVTDAKGVFHFPEITRTSFWAGLMPHEPMIRTSVKARPPSGEVLLLDVTKRDYTPDAELEGRDLVGPGINVECRVDREPDTSGPFYGTCRALK